MVVPRLYDLASYPTPSGNDSLNAIASVYRIGSQTAFSLLAPIVQFDPCRIQP